jgi:hypothetical protein
VGFISDPCSETLDMVLAKLPSTVMTLVLRCLQVVLPPIIDDGFHHRVLF